MTKKPPVDLQHVLWSGDAHAIAKALSGKVDLDHPGAEGQTMLMEAVLEKRADLVKLLLDHHADPKKADQHGSTALHFAAMEHLPEVAQLLIDKGAVVDAKDHLGNTPLAKALSTYRGQANGDAIWTLLLAGADKTIKNTHGVSPEDLSRGPSNYDLGQFFR